MRRSLTTLAILIWLFPCGNIGNLKAQGMAFLGNEGMLISTSSHQNDRVQKIDLEEALKIIEQRYKVYFTYPDELIKNKTVSLRLKAGETLDQLLSPLLRPHGLQHEKVRGKFYVITSRTNTGSSNADRPVTSGTSGTEFPRSTSSRPHFTPVPQLASPRSRHLKIFQFPLSGQILDESGDPLIGVNVLVKGSGQGTVTDIEGRFALDLQDGNATLVVSYVDFQSVEVPVNNRSEISITLVENAAALEEVVVIGFGTKQRKDVTEAISSVSGEELNQLPVTSFEQALGGYAAGVQVISGSGIPGAGATIRVRGVGSLNNSEPLYVIDGIIIGNVAGGGQSSISPLALINPNDIESIDILKDASATAIYGARAGNGVVIITTKRGKQGQMSINFDTYTSFSVLDRSNFDMMSGPQWAQYLTEAYASAGQTDYPGKPFLDKVLAGNGPQEYNWFDYAYRDGRINSYNLSLNAGTAKSRYYVSANYFDQEGILPNSNLKRGTVRLNSDHKVSNRLSFGNTLAVSRSEAQTVGNVNANSNLKNWIGRLLIQNPYKPIFDPTDGDYAGLSAQDPDAEAQLDFSNTHTIWVLENQYEQDVRNRIWGSLYADYEIFNGLTFHTMGSVDWSFNDSEDRHPSNTIDGAQANDNTNNRFNLRHGEFRTWFMENTLTYAKRINQHDFSIMGGYQAQNNLNKGFSANGGGFVNTDYWFFNRPQLTSEIVDGNGNVVATIPLVTPGVGNYQNESAFVSFLGRAIYNYDDRYLLTLTVRRDGSSRFGPDKRWGTFPAVSAGWRIHQEPFMQSGSSKISNLKLRAGYGISGSDNTGLYQWNSQVGSGDNLNYVFNGGRVPGATLTRLANQFLGWEEIEMYNFGLDLGLFEGRLEVTIDYFDKTTKGMLLQFAPSLEVGSQSDPTGNLGEVDNSGIEVAISSVNVARSNFTWRTDFNISAVRNEIVRLPENADRFNGNNISRVGEEIGALYGFQVNGLFQNWTEVYSHAYQNQSVESFGDDGLPIYTGNTDQATINNNTAPGDQRFVDQNGDGIIDADNDRVIIGSTIPDFTWGLNNYFRLGGFNLAVSIQGVHGVDVFNGLRAGQEGSIASWSNKRTTILNRWTGEGTSNSIPRSALTNPNGNGGASDFAVEDGSFIRLRNIRLSYNFPAQVLRNIGWQKGGIELYGSATNLLTLTQYTGFDPEIGLRVAGNPETAGSDSGAYPLSRQFTLGLKLSF
ncbi:SusC/RagA family TonB-linked outer membrane protein [Flavilitoribacter nigricans]|nr:SusC/RagA family TonB-linked outer membrane protein [Flavilitoribacter nigricans]